MKKYAADKSHRQGGSAAGGFLAGGAKPILFLTAMGGLIWGLVTLSGPERHLEPYNSGGESLASPVSTGDSAEGDPPTEASSPAPGDSGDLEKVAQVDKPSSREDRPPAPETVAAAGPSLNLPRATLEHISRGMGLAEQGKYELAELEFEKAAEISPNSSEVFAIWGAAHRMQGKFKGANKRFQRANELAPDDEEILFNWGLSRLHEKKANEAIQLFKATLELDPKHYMAYNYLGKSYGQNKDYSREAAAYRDALKIKEDFAQGHFNLGVVLSLMKEFEEAAPHFQRAIALDPEFDKPFVNQFLVAMGLRKNQQADLKPSPQPETPGGEKTADKQKNPKAEASEKTGDAKADEGSHGAHKAEEGSDGSGEKIVNPITRVQGAVKINGEPAGAPGLVILETKTKLKVPQQSVSQLRIVQRGLNFQPQHSVVMVGSTVEFINDDREIHNIFSKSRNNQFNLGAMAAGSSRKISLTQPGPIVLRCNLHKDMIGTLFVVPNGYYAEVDAQGQYTLPEVKSQEYLLQVWHPRLAPEEVEKNLKNVSLTGVDQTLDFAIASQSAPGEIHDMVDATDYSLLVTNIENEVREAIRNWKEGKKYLSHKRMLKAITYYYDGGGLKGALAKSFSENRSRNLEKSLDTIRKKIAGLDKEETVTEAQLNTLAERAFSQLHNNVRELYARLNPDQPPLP